MTQTETGPVGRWLTFQRERAPLPVLLAVGVPQALSSYWLFRTGFEPGRVMISALGIMALVFLLRLMDEVKDVAKDKVAHPERPLPRGLFRESEARRAVDTVGAVLFGAAIGIGYVLSPIPGVFYGLCVGYAFLMYREFFAPRLIRDPLLYALTHQIIVILMYLFTVLVASPGAYGSAALWWALTGLAASFSVEVARKLDPLAHPVLNTYLQHYGRTVVTSVLLASLSLLAFAAWKLGLHPIVWPFVGLAVLAVALFYAQPRRFKIVQGVIVLAALVQSLAPTLRYAWTALR